MKNLYSRVCSGTMAACLFCSHFVVAQDTWIQKASFPLARRTGAVNFSIGDNVYVVTGDGTRDVWQYNTLLNTWTQKNNFGGVGRSDAVGFVIDGKGYVGTGRVSSNSPSVVVVVNDFWEYDPANDSWLQKANMPGEGRFGAVSFAANGKGYVMGGKIFWEYDPIGNLWVQKTDFPGSSRFRASAFSIGDKGYVGCGYYSTAPQHLIMLKDFYEYNTTTNSWTQKADYAGYGRNQMSAFVINSIGYFGFGDATSCGLTPICSYNGP